MLRGVVRYLWCAPASNTGGRERVVPSGTMQLIVNLDADVLRSFRTPRSREATVRPGAVVQGMHSAAFGLDGSVRQAVAGAVVEPGGAGRMIGSPLDELAGEHVALEALWGRVAADRLRTRACEAKDPAAVLDALEESLEARVMARRRSTKSGVAHGEAEVRRALSRIEAGEDRVQALARAVGWSERRLHRRFAALVGLSPKAMIRVTRFGRALTRLRAGDDLAAVAARCGYFDQAHLGHEFQALAGLAPGAYVAEMSPHRHHVPQPVE